MDQKYVITEEELAEKGLDLNDYALEGTLIPAIINISLDICVDRICKLCDEISGENDIEEKVGDDPNKIRALKKLQYRCIHNLIFMGETEPTDAYFDDIISQQLKIGRINSIQKGYYHRER